MISFQSVEYLCNSSGVCIFTLIHLQYKYTKQGFLSLFFTCSSYTYKTVVLQLTVVLGWLQEMVIRGKTNKPLPYPIPTILNRTKNVIETIWCNCLMKIRAIGPDEQIDCHIKDMNVYNFI